MDPGADDREQLAERVEQLESTVEQQQSTIRKMLPGRRGVIKGVGAAVGGGLLGASATGGASGQSGPAGRQGTPENPNDMFAWDLDVANEVVTDLPMGGNGLTDLGSLNGDVYVSPGDDLQSRVDAVPPGGRLIFEPGAHDPADVGIATAEQPMTIIWTGGESGAGNAVGSVIDNTGSDAVAGPILQLQGGTDGSDWEYNYRLVNPVIDHEGTGPAIDIDTPMTQIIQPSLYGDGTPDSLIHLSQDGWGTQIHGGRFSSNAARQINDQADGGLKTINGTQVLGGDIGLYAGRGWRVVDTDFNQDVGLDLVGGGSVVRGARFEGAGIGIRVARSDEATAQTDYAISDCEFRNVDDVCIEYDEVRYITAGTHARLVDGATSGNAIRFTSNSQHVTQKINMAQRVLSWDDQGSQNLINFDGSPRLANALSVNQPVEGMELFSPADGERIFYDGGGWVLVSEPATTASNQY